jgi:hypothetical protein
LNASHNNIPATSSIKCQLPALEVLLIHHNPLTKIELDYVEAMFETFPALRTCDDLGASDYKSFRLDWLANWNGLGLERVY